MGAFYRRRRRAAVSLAIHAAFRGLRVIFASFIFDSLVLKPMLSLSDHLGCPVEELPIGLFDLSRHSLSHFWRYAAESTGRPSKHALRSLVVLDGLESRRYFKEDLCYLPNVAESLQALVLVVDGAADDEELVAALDTVGLAFRSDLGSPVGDVEHSPLTWCSGGGTERPPASGSNIDEPADRRCPVRH